MLVPAWSCRNADSCMPKSIHGGMTKDCRSCAWYAGHHDPVQPCDIVRDQILHRLTFHVYNTSIRLDEALGRDSSPIQAAGGQHARACWDRCGWRSAAHARQSAVAARLHGRVGADTCEAENSLFPKRSSQLHKARTHRFRIVERLRVSLKGCCYLTCAG